jgi:signal transduction histidine kinase
VPTGNLLRSTTFRFALVYLCLFSAAVLVLVGFIYWSTTGAVSRQIESTIEAEVRGLAEQYEQRGLSGLVAAIKRRAAAPERGLGLYLLAGPSFEPLAGNLSAWPDAAPEPGGWITFRLDSPTGEAGGINFARAKVFSLGRSLHLLVGHDVRERSLLAGLIAETLIWGLTITVALSLLGGLVMSRLLLARIEKISRTSRDIMAGDLGRRIPLSGRGDEFDRLAEELNKMLDQIERLLEGMRQVSDNIAHDLRSPLARLRSRLEVTLMEPGDEGRYREALSQTIDEADTLLQTFNALLSIAQAEAGAARQDFSDVDLGAVLADVMELYEPLAEARGLTLSLRASGPVTIAGDPHLLSQALANLLDNAIKFSEAPAPVELTLTAEGAEVRLAVADRGPGIPVEACEKVMERFFRLEGSRSTPGSGLGLSLAAAVARLHGGRLTLEDNAPGLRAVLSLPLKLGGTP